MAFAMKNLGLAWMSMKMMPFLTSSGWDFDSHTAVDGLQLKMRKNDSDRWSIRVTPVQNSVMIAAGQLDKDGLIHGIGTVIFPDGETQIGNFEKGNFEKGNGSRLYGNGVAIYANGNKYVGQFSNSRKHGCGVIYLYANKTQFTGQWSNELWVSGVFKSPNGDKYRVENGKVIGNAISEAEVEAGVNGICVQAISDATRSEEKLIEKINNSSQSKLTLSEENKVSFSAGQFKDGMLHGLGALIFPDGEKQIGNFNNDKLDGNGIVFFADGDKYVGRFRNGKMDGRGIMSYANKAKFTGNWSNGRRLSGIHIFADGGKYTGEFDEEGRFDGPSIYAGAGQVTGNFYKNGKFIQGWNMDMNNWSVDIDGRIKQIGEISKGKWLQRDNFEKTINWATSDARSAKYIIMKEGKLIDACNKYFMPRTFQLQSIDCEDNVREKTM